MMVLAARRAGRTGRMGARGTMLTLVPESEVARHERMLRKVLRTGGALQVRLSLLLLLPWAPARPQAPHPLTPAHCTADGVHPRRWRWSFMRRAGSTACAARKPARCLAAPAAGPLARRQVALWVEKVEEGAEEGAGA
jgi:hypothetical protein